MRTARSTPQFMDQCVPHCIAYNYAIYSTTDCNNSFAVHRAWFDSHGGGEGLGLTPGSWTDKAQSSSTRPRRWQPWAGSGKYPDPSTFRDFPPCNLKDPGASSIRDRPPSGTIGLTPQHIYTHAPHITIPPPTHPQRVVESGPTVTSADYVVLLTGSPPSPLPCPSHSSSPRPRVPVTLTRILI